MNNIIANNQSKNNSFDVDLTSLIDFQNSDDLDYWAYQGFLFLSFIFVFNTIIYNLGSLSMPTCDENTNWYLIKKTFEANKTEIDYFVNLYHNNTGFSGDGNYRELQSGNRTLKISVMDFQRN